MTSGPPLSEGQIELHAGTAGCVVVEFGGDLDLAAEHARSGGPAFVDCDGLPSRVVEIGSSGWERWHGSASRGWLGG